MQFAEPKPVLVYRWKPGEEPQEVGLGGIANALAEGVPVWIDISILQDPIVLGQMLARVLPGLAPGKVARLINPQEEDLAPAATPRLVRWVRFDAPQTVPAEGGPDLFVGRLHLLRGQGWLLTFRPPGLEAGGGRGGPDVKVGNLVDSIRGMWTLTHQNVDDLATLMLFALSRSYPNAVANLATYLGNSDLARWDESSRAPDAETLRALAFRVDTLALQLRSLEQPGVPSDRAWFEPGENRAEAAAVERILVASRMSLDGLRRDVRGVIDYQRTERTTERSARLQVVLGTLASLFLGPTLAATIFGAFPGWLSEQPSARAAALGASSLALVVATGLGLWASADPRKPFPFLRTRGMVAVFVSVLVCAGVGLLIRELATAEQTRGASESRPSGKSDPQPRRDQRAPTPAPTATPQPQGRRRSAGRARRCARSSAPKTKRSREECGRARDNRATSNRR